MVSTASTTRNQRSSGKSHFAVPQDSEALKKLASELQKAKDAVANPAQCLIHVKAVVKHAGTAYAQMAGRRAQELEGKLDRLTKEGEPLGAKIFQFDTLFMDWKALRASQIDDETAKLEALRNLAGELQPLVATCSPLASVVKTFFAPQRYRETLLERLIHQVEQTEQRFSELRWSQPLGHSDASGGDFEEMRLKDAACERAMSSYTVANGAVQVGIINLRNSIRAFSPSAQSSKADLLTIEAELGRTKVALEQGGTHLQSLSHAMKRASSDLVRNDVLQYLKDFLETELQNYQGSLQRGASFLSTSRDTVEQLESEFRAKGSIGRGRSRSHQALRFAERSDGRPESQDVVESTLMRVQSVARRAD